MVTIKLKKPGPTGQAPVPKRSPVRGSGAGVKSRPTLAEAQRQRADREALYQEQLRQRGGGPNAAVDPRAGPRRSPARPAFGAPPRGPAHFRTPPQQPQRPQRPQEPPQQDPPPQPRQPWQPPQALQPWQSQPPQQQRLQRPQKPQRPLQPHQPHQPHQPYQPQPASLRRPFDRGTPDARPARTWSADDDDDDVSPAHAEHPPGSMRLSKRMSELGIASRREADEWIAKGWVRVDDRVVSALGSRVMPEQRVTIDAQAKYQQAQKVTVLINKPVGHVSGQAEDGYEPAVVLVTPANQWLGDHSGTRFLREHTKNLVPAGRLDIDSVGLLVLTQDGRIAKQLIGEESDIEKEYLVRVATPTTSAAADRPSGPSALSASDLDRLRHGLELDGEALLPATVEWVNDDQLRFVLRQGKKRQIRRMCEAVGLQVLGLKRVRIGQVMLGDLPVGQWRYLRREEGF